MTQIGTVRAGTDLDDACDILRDRIGWYTAASDVAEKPVRRMLNGPVLSLPLILSDGTWR